jgi:peptidoglycan hydrolase-like protein with peptidoglycan-binding domain
MANRFQVFVATIQQGEALRHGCSGEAVAQLQACLNTINRAWNLREDGDFGPKTHQAVCAFQNQNQLRADGVVGPITLRALLALLPSGESQTAQRTQGPTRGAAEPSGRFIVEAGRVSRGFDSSLQARLSQAEQLLRSFGQWPPESGRAYVIQIDQDSPPPEASHTDRWAYVRSYSGQMAVFYGDAGRLIEQQSPLRSASHPGQFKVDKAKPPDVNGDGEPDIAWLRPGVYHYRSNPNDDGRYNPANLAEFRGVARDYTHDGVIDEEEAQGRYQAAGIQIHVSGSAGPASIGCQTLPPDEFQRLQRAIEQANRGQHSDFTYILVRRPNDRFGSHEF